MYIKDNCVNIYIYQFVMNICSSLPDMKIHSNGIMCLHVDHCVPPIHLFWAFYSS